MEEIEAVPDQSRQMCEERATKTSVWWEGAVNDYHQPLCGLEGALDLGIFRTNRNIVSEETGDGNEGSKSNDDL